MAAGAADKAHDRADVDDRAAARFRHLFGGELGAEKDAGLVDRDDLVPALDAVGVADRAAGDPGIVDEDVEPAIGLQRFGDQRLPLRLAGDVDRRRAGFAAGVTDLGGDALGLAAENVGDHDSGALLRKEARLGLAHAVPRPGDDRDLVLEAHRSLPRIGQVDRVSPSCAASFVKRRRRGDLPRYDTGRRLLPFAGDVIPG